MESVLSRLLHQPDMVLYHPGALLRTLYMYEVGYVWVCCRGRMDTKDWKWSSQMVVSRCWQEVFSLYLWGASGFDIIYSFSVQAWGPWSWFYENDSVSECRGDSLPPLNLFFTRQRKDLTERRCWETWVATNAHFFLFLFPQLQVAHIHGSPQTCPGTASSSSVAESHQEKE